MASFLAAATSHATHGEPMIPFYWYYSMFGFPRVGDQIWQAADMNGRGFLMGCTAGRTTLNGEGLQHEDGHSLLVASTNPAVVSYEPSFAYECAVLIEDGLRRMLSGENVLYYMALQNEAYQMPAKPEGVDEGIRRGMYRLRAAEALPGFAQKKSAKRLQLLGSGSILGGVLEAQKTLWTAHGVAADVWVVTSYSELRREAMAVDIRNRRAGVRTEIPFVAQLLGGTKGPIVAASDWMRAVPDQIAPWLGGRLKTLGTDGFGMSDTRETLRRHFEVDAQAVVELALWELG